MLQSRHYHSAVLGTLAKFTAAVVLYKHIQQKLRPVFKNGLLGKLLLGPFEPSDFSTSWLTMLGDMVEFGKTFGLGKKTYEGLNNCQCVF